MFSSIGNLNKKSINKPALLCLQAADCLNNLIVANVLSKKEIMNENHLQIVNEFCKATFQFYEVLKSRINNALVKEKILLTITYISEIKDKENRTPTVKKSIKLSEVIDKYLPSKISDGKEREAHIPELRSHLLMFLEIIGDKAIKD